MSIEKKQKISKELPKELIGNIREFFGMSGSETVSGFLHSHRDAQRLCRDAQIEFMTGASGANVRWVKAYAKLRKARAELKCVF